MDKGPFESILMVDWSGGNDRGAKPKKDAIWIGSDGDGPTTQTYFRNRLLAESWLLERLDDAAKSNERLLVGFDFAFAYPNGFSKALIGCEDTFALWDWFEARVEDSPNANNRFDLAAQINRRFPGVGPFWFNGLRRDIADLPRKGTDRTFIWDPPIREVERRATGTFQCWQLGGAGSVGSQIIMGLPLLSRLRKRFGPQRLSVWPYENRVTSITLVEIWPSLIANAVQSATRDGDIKDAVQVGLLARTLASLGPDITQMMQTRVSEEGWILGVGHEEMLRTAASRQAFEWRAA